MGESQRERESYKNGKAVLAELHWYEANGEKYEIKIKRYLDES